MKRLGIVLLSMIVAGGALAEGASPDGAGRAGEEIVRLTPPKEGWLVQDLIGKVTAYTGHPILFEPDNPAIRGKKVQWAGDIDVPRDELFRWFRAVLSTQRLIVIPVGPREADLWMVVEINATQIGNHPEYVAPEDLEKWKDADGCYITTTLAVDHLTDTSRARNALAQLSTRPNGKINDIPGARAFVIADFAPVVWAMREQLRQMDVLSEAENAKAARAAYRNTRPPSRAGSAAATAPDARRRELEQALVGSRTEIAARYFLDEIRALDAKADGDD